MYSESQHHELTKKENYLNSLSWIFTNNFADIYLRARTHTHSGDTLNLTELFQNLNWKLRKMLVFKEKLTYSEVNINLTSLKKSNEVIHNVLYLEWQTISFLHVVSNRFKVFIRFLLNSSQCVCTYLSTLIFADTFLCLVFLNTCSVRNHSPTVLKASSYFASNILNVF